MRRILLGLTLAGAGTVIALNARYDLLEDSQAPSAQAPTAAVAPDRGPIDRVEPTDRPAPAGPVEEIGAHAGAGVTPAAQPAADPTGSAEATPDARTPEIRTPDARTPEAPASEARTPDAQTPDAATVLRRASAAYGEVRSLQAEFDQEMRNPLLRSTTTSRGTLYQRRPDRFLMRFREPAGDLIVSDGRSIWVYYPSVDEKQVIRMPAGAGGAGGVDLQSQFLGDPLARFTPVLEGKEEVAGRPAYVLTLTPKEPVGYRKLKVWVDARDHLVRRFELTEENGSVRRFDLRDLRVNPTLADDLFRFTPPPGAHVVDRG